MNSRGFSLVELVVIIAIIGILLSIGTINYTDWLKRYQNEKQTRELHSDISNLRLDAMQQKRRSVILLGPKQYIFKTYSSLGENIVTGGVVVLNRVVNYEMRKLVGANYNTFDINTDVIEFDQRGFVNINIMTIVLMPVTLNAGDNCVVVHTARTNIGRMTDASSCTFR